MLMLLLKYQTASCRLLHQESPWLRRPAMAAASVSARTEGTATTLARPARVVRRSDGQVVMILAGRDAPAEAAVWASRGYLVDPISDEVLG